MENKKVSIQELVDTIAAQSNFSKRFTENFLHELVAVIQEYLEKDGVVKVKGLGTFKLLWNEERKSINVSTGQDLIIPGHYKVSFTPETGVKEKVNAPYAHLETVMGGAALISEQPKEQVLGAADAPVTPAEPQQPISSVEESVAPVQEPATPQEAVEPKTSVAESTSEPKAEVAPEQPAPEPTPEPTPEPVSAVAEDATSEVADEPAAPKKKSKAGAIVGIVIVVVAILICVLAYFYYIGSINCKYLDKMFSSIQQKEWVVPADSILNEEVAVPDTSVQVEDYYAATGTEPSQTPEEVVETPKVLTLENYTYQDALDAPTREVVTVIPGSRLTMIAYRAYGSKDFWVYVYDANRNVLQDPASVEKGMQLRIADLPASLVNPQDPACLEKAAELAKQY